MTKTLYFPPNFSTEIAQPYAAGQTLDEIGANVLNTALYDNIRNNLRNKITKLQENWKKANPEIEWPGLTSEQKDEFANFAAGYSLSLRSSTPTDPVEAEAHRIARGIIEDALRAKGATPSHYKDRMPEFIAKTLEKRPGIREEAQRRIDARKEVIAETLDLAGIV